MTMMMRASHHIPSLDKKNKFIIRREIENARGDVNMREFLRRAKRIALGINSCIRKRVGAAKITVSTTRTRRGGAANEETLTTANGMTLPTCVQTAVFTDPTPLAFIQYIQEVWGQRESRDEERKLPQKGIARDAERIRYTTAVISAGCGRETTHLETLLWITHMSLSFMNRRRTTLFIRNRLRPVSHAMFTRSTPPQKGEGGATRRKRKDVGLIVYYINVTAAIERAQNAEKRKNNETQEPGNGTTDEEPRKTQNEELN